MSPTLSWSEPENWDPEKWSWPKSEITGTWPTIQSTCLPPIHSTYCYCTSQWKYKGADAFSNVKDSFSSKEKKKKAVKYSLELQHNKEPYQDPDYWQINGFFYSSLVNKLCFFFVTSKSLVKNLCSWNQVRNYLH